MVLRDPRRRALHDRLAGTRVETATSAAGRATSHGMSDA